MLISADLTPLKKLAQDHPTAWVIDLSQQLQLTTYVHLVKPTQYPRDTEQAGCRTR